MAFINHHLHFPAELVGGFTLKGLLLDKQAVATGV